MFHILICVFHVNVYKVLGLFVSRETLSSIYFNNFNIVSRETLSKIYKFGNYKGFLEATPDFLGYCLGVSFTLFITTKFR